MTWVVYSVLAMAFFVGVILFTKALTIKQLEPEILSLYFFLSTAVGFLLIAFFRRTSFAVPTSSYLLFLGIAIVTVAYNMFLVKAIKAAPNPAYPQAILSASVIVIALVSIVLFGCELSITKMAGVVLTVIGVLFVSLSSSVHAAEKSPQGNYMTWVVHSVLAMVLFVGIILFTKALTTKQLEPEILNLYFFLSTSVGFVLIAFFRRTSFTVPTSSYLLFLGIAIVAVAYNIFLVKAIEAAPNPAYPQAILSTNVIVIALASMVLFGCELRITKMAGVVLTVIGVLFVSLSK